MKQLHSFSLPYPPASPVYKELLLIAIQDNGEPMVNITEYLTDCICEYQNDDMLPYVGKTMWVRRSIALKLAGISEKLRNDHPGYKLKIVYGYRHPDIQRARFEIRKSEVLQRMPHLFGDDLDEEANTMTANPLTAGHPTGGAVDVTIVGPDRKEIDMGTKISDFSDTEKIQMFSKQLTQEQQDNRMLLHDLMLSGEFAPYYGEWWHYSFGDREWAWFYDKPVAIYDQMEFKFSKN